MTKRPRKRTNEDPEWMSLKRQVAERDHGCRLMRICTPQEYYILIRKAGSRASHCDPAHVFGAGPFPWMCYVKANVVQLNRFSHDCLDSCKSPITGEDISREERDSWWKRIVGSTVYEELLRMSYKGEEDE